MLTQEELKWLEGRGKPDYPAACVRFLKEKWDFNQEECKFCCYSDRERRILLCPLVPDYKDAAEFEARTAKILAKSPCFECQDKHGPNSLSCIEKLTREGAEACRLKHARIRAEQEMETGQC